MTKAVLTPVVVAASKLVPVKLLIVVRSVVVEPFVKVTLETSPEVKASVNVTVILKAAPRAKTLLV